jgi:hypothetical protein
MHAERLTLGTLSSRTLAAVRRKALVFLGWALVALLLGTPCAMLFLQQANFTGGPIDPVALWHSFTPFEKLKVFLYVWFMSLGLLGLTQAIATLATWDTYTQQPTTVSNLAARLIPRLHRILGLQLFMAVMVIVIFPISIFAIHAILIDNLGVFKAIGKSVNMWSRNAGKAILILFLAFVVALGWRLPFGPVAALEDHNLLLGALALEARLAMFYLAGVIVGIPTTLIYSESGGPLQASAQQRVARR